MKAPNLIWQYKTVGAGPGSRSGKIENFMTDGLSELDRIAIDRIALSYPFTKEEITQAYRVFGLHFTPPFLNKVQELAIGMESALNLIGQLQAHQDIPAKWDDIATEKKTAYFRACMNWLTATMNNTTSLDAEEL